MNRQRATSVVIVVVVPAIVSLAVSLLVLTVWNSRALVQPEVLVLPTAGGTALIPPRGTEGSGGSGVAESAPSGGTPCENPVHNVASGETLGVIAQSYDVPVEDIIVFNRMVDPAFNPDLLSIGQAIMIPVCGVPTLTPTLYPTDTPFASAVVPTPLPTLSPLPPGPINVRIERIEHIGDLAQEAAIIINWGANVQLSGWVLSNGRDEFTFPSMILFGGGAVTVHTRSGENGPIDLYWGLDQPAWQVGDQALLYDASGNLQHEYRVED